MPYEMVKEWFHDICCLNTIKTLNFQQLKLGITVLPPLVRMRAIKLMIFCLFRIPLILSNFLR